MGFKKKRHSDESSSLIENHDEKDHGPKCFPVNKGERFYDKYIWPLNAEFLAVAIFVFLGVLSSTKPGLLVPATVHGAALALLVIIFLPISGGHVNPAVTLGVALSGNMGAFQAVFYVMAQCVGSIVGAAAAMAVLDDPTYDTMNGGVLLLQTNISILQGLFTEAILVFILVLTVLITVADNNSMFAPLAIGFALFADILAGGSITGAAVNPARALGPAVIFSKEGGGHWSDHWVYWVGAILGALVAAVLFRFILASAKKRTVCHDEDKEPKADEKHKD